MILNVVLASFAFLSVALLLWQWIAARRFPLHRRMPARGSSPAVSLLKPLKGNDVATEACLRSWFEQDYQGEVQLLFAVASAEDPVCPVVQGLIAQYPRIAAELVVVDRLDGTNAKVSKLMVLEQRAVHEILVVSDADVRVERDFLTQAVTCLQRPGAGLVNCFYRLANPSTLAMHWESIAINADFWSQVLQSTMLKPIDFALGAVMVTRRTHLESIGGFRALADCLADDYQLGHRISKTGQRIELCPIVVECWDPPKGWAAVWSHQLRWARTIRVCQPVPYFFSILSNPSLWPLVWACAAPSIWSGATLLVSLGLRCGLAFDLQHRLTRSVRHWAYVWLAPVKDLIQVAIWIGAFAGSTIEWRGQHFRLRPDGTIVRRQ